MSIETNDPKIINNISDNPVEKTEFDGGVSLEKVELSCDLSNKDKKLGSVALGGTELVKGPEIIKKDRNQIGYSLLSCYEACKVKDMLYEHQDYIGIDDVRDLYNTNYLDDVGRLCGLLQFEKDITDRVDAEQKIQKADRLNKDQLKKIKFYVNTKHIVAANKKIYEVINDFASDEEKNNFKFLRSYLLAKMDNAKSRAINNNELDSFTIDDYDTSMIFGQANGMRHEAAFKVLLAEISDVIDFEDCSNFDDSNGVDLVLKVKVSELMNDSGYFEYATPDEIASENFKVLDLPVDIKSTWRRADESLRKVVNSGYEINHWVLWSNFYPEDFLLDVDDSDEVVLYTDTDRAVLLPVKDKQIAAMKRIGSIRYERQNGKTIKPEILSKRLYDIKNEVLNGINKMYGKNR